METIKCRISEVKLKNEDTLFIDIESEKDFSAQDFNELKQAAEHLGKGKKLYNIINVGEFTLPNKEAREISCSSEGSEFKKADAFIIHSMPQKILANLMLKINIPAVPTKFFSKIEDAEIWINNLIRSEVRLT